MRSHSGWDQGGCEGGGEKQLGFIDEAERIC